MTKLKLIVVILVMAGVGIFWAIEHQSQVRLLTENAALRQQVEQITQLEAENERLSNMVAQANGPAAKTQLSELLKLRGEVTRLREQTNELQRLRAQNGRLQSALNSGDDASVSPATNSTPVKPPLAVFPRSAWAFAGFATPEAAFQSLNWAASTGDLDAFLANLTPDMQKEMARQFENKSAAEVIDQLKNRINENTEVSILSKNEISDHEVVLEILGSKEGMNHPDKLVFQKINGQWKFSSNDAPKPPQPGTGATP